MSMRHVCELEEGKFSMTCILLQIIYLLKQMFDYFSKCYITLFIRFWTIKRMSDYTTTMFYVSFWNDYWLFIND